MRSTLAKVRDAPASTKARILNAAEAVFASQGFPGASTREIAAAAGVNISSLHYHWESKETLYFAVFQNIYDRILQLVRRTIPQRPDAALDTVLEAAMGDLYDFFADHPNIPKLLVRRLLENEERHVDIERDILVPAWKMFAGWTQISGRKRNELELQLFMLSVHSVLLLFLLDSRQFTSLLGASVYDPAMRRRVRTHIIRLVRTLLTSNLSDLER